MQHCLMMTDLDVFQDEHTGQTRQSFPPEHPVHLEMRKNAKKLRDNDGYIYSEGLYIFQKPMDTNVIHPHLFQTAVNANNNQGLIL